MFSLLKKYELQGAKLWVRLFNRFQIQIESVLNSLSLTKIICWERLDGVTSLRRRPESLTSRFTTSNFSTCRWMASRWFLYPSISQTSFAQNKGSPFSSVMVWILPNSGFSTRHYPHTLRFTTYGVGKQHPYIGIFLSSSVPQFCSRGYTRYLQIVSNYILLYIYI